jgi:hypothetical protein
VRVTVNRLGDRLRLEDKHPLRGHGDVVDVEAVAYEIVKGADAIAGKRVEVLGDRHLAVASLPELLDLSPRTRSSSSLSD